ncbi:glycosyltransferase [Treponema sp. OttesenSCG-928-L16]|nr:glycosyltransferase [Treponema sp. OttesenSCG-928-L16]
MIAYNIFRFVFFAVFTGLHCALMAGLILEYLRDREALKKGLSSASVPAVSVIVPIHNEEHRIQDLLRSLGLQDYPKREFIFIDDRSDDRSGTMLREFAASRQDTMIITLKENPGPNHKQYALCRGIEVSSGALILLTDADCEVPPAWIRAMVTRMEDERTGIIIAPVFKRPGGRGFFHLYQCFDHAVRYMYLAASTGLGAAGGGFGNNLILRKAALEKVGGYDAVPPSPTEDAALVSLVRSRSEYSVRAACGADVHVMTRGESAWAPFINQTLRWNNGGLFSPDLATRLNFGFLMITISMGILTIPLLPFVPSIWPLPSAVMISMLMNSIATLKLFGASLPKAGPAYIIQLIFTPMYFTFLTLLGFLRKKTTWKESEVK